MADFPPAGFEREDAKYYKTAQEDGTIRSSSEGGYEMTRRRFTRNPRKTYTTGFTEITDAQLQTLESIWDANMGHTIFQWTHPIRGTVHDCRFTKPFEVSYSGKGSHRVYNVKIELKEV